MLDKIKQSLEGKATPAPTPKKQVDYTPPPAPFPQYHSDDVAINNRYRLINSIINLEYINSKERIYNMLEIKKQVGYDDEETNKLLSIYAPKLINKVVGKFTHLINIMKYAGIREPNTGEDIQDAEKSRVGSNKNHSVQFEWNA